MAFFSFAKNTFHSLEFILKQSGSISYKKIFHCCWTFRRSFLNFQFLWRQYYITFPLHPILHQCCAQQQRTHDQLDLEPSALHRALQDICRAGWALFLKFGNFDVLGFNPNDLKLPSWQAPVLNQIKKYSIWILSPWLLLPCRTGTGW